MKKILLTIVLLLSLLCSCADTTRTANTLPLDEYIEGASLPQGFELNFDTLDVASRDIAKIYNAKNIRFSVDMVAPAIMIGDISETVSYAEGMQYRSGDTELCDYLTIYDAGESFGYTGLGDGGFNYTVVDNGVLAAAKLGAVISTNSEYSTSRLANPGQATEDYSSNGELAGVDYTSAVSEVIRTLSAAGTPELLMKRYYCLDLETMKAHATLSGVDYEYDGHDEGYLFFFSQSIDGIPVTDTSWKGKGAVTVTGNPMYGTSATVYYTNQGLVYAYLHNLFLLTDSGKEASLISSSEALDSLLQLFSNVIPGYDYSVISMELNYVSIPAEDGYELRPAWTFCLSKSSGDQVLSYNYYVFDAVTGEILSA